MDLTTIQLTDEELLDYKEFLSDKKKRLLEQLNGLEKQITKLVSNNSKPKTTKVIEPGLVEDEKSEQANNDNSTAWKYKVDEVLKMFDRPTQAREILEVILKNEPELESKRETIRKNIASALSLNSTPKKQRYLFETNGRTKSYYLNEKYKE